MRWARLVAFGLLLALVAVRWPAELRARGLEPWWLLLPALWFGLRARPGAALAVGWAFGLAADLLSLEPLGWHAFLFGAIGLLLARLRPLFFHGHPLTQAVLAFALAFLAGALSLVRVAAAEPSFAALSRLPAALAAALLTALVFPALVVVEFRTGLFRGFAQEERRVPA